MAEQLPKWDAVGVEPPTVLKTDGWQPGMKPSAQHMNWLFNRIYKCLEEIQLNGGTEEIQQELAALQELVTAHQAERATPTTLGHVKAETDQDGNLILPEMSASNVTTTSGSTVQTEIDNLKSSVSDGKNLVKNAIAGKGGTVLDGDGDGVSTFAELEAGVSGITSRGKFTKVGEVPNITFQTTYQRTTISKRFLYSQDSGTTSIGVTNLETSQPHGVLVNPTNYVDYLKSDYIEDHLYGYRSGVLSKFDQDYNRIWFNNSINSLSWSTVTFDDLYVYGITSADSKIRRINRLTGMTELTSPHPVVSGSSGTLIVQKELKRLVYVITSSTGVYITIYNYDDLTSIRHINHSNTTGNYSYGGFFTKSLRYLYYFVTAADSILYLCILDTAPATPQFLVSRPIGFVETGTLAGSQASLWTDKGFALNASHNPMIINVDSNNELSYSINGVYDKSYNKTNGHRYIGIDSQKNLSHGIYS